jgi:tRNA modification GTPase
MLYRVDDTITAIATAPGASVRGLVRVSGPATIGCLESCFQADRAEDLRALKRATVIPGSLRLADHGRELPCDLYLWPSERSYTRQISAELHTFGSLPLLDAIVEVLCQQGARLAEPGEFTMRAFLAGRLDLTQAEAVLGVIDARGSQSLDVALKQLAGGLAGPLQQLRSDLLDLLADLEAGLDFADEDIDFIDTEQAGMRLTNSEHSIRLVLQQITSRGRSQQLPRVVLRGWPNVGKSSLINALCDDPVALVSDQAGTTRDYVSRSFNWQGTQGLLIDTAGIDRLPERNSVEAEAQRLADEQHQQADLELLCLDGSRPLSRAEAALLVNPTANRLVVWTKADLPGPAPLGVPAVSTSSRSGAGIDRLRKLICRRLAAGGAPESLVVASTAQRCRTSLESALQHLQRAARLLSGNQGHELVAIELRESLERLGQVVGAVYTDDILDRVFQRFCIGK